MLDDCRGRCVAQICSILFFRLRAEQKQLRRMGSDEGERFPRKFKMQRGEKNWAAEKENDMKCVQVQKIQQKIHLKIKQEYQVHVL